MSDALDVRYAIFTDEARGLVACVLLEVDREFGVSGERWLDGDDGIGGELGNAGSCFDVKISISIQFFLHFCTRPRRFVMVALYDAHLPSSLSMAGHVNKADGRTNSPASPAVRTKELAILPPMLSQNTPEKKTIFLPHRLIDTK